MQDEAGGGALQLTVNGAQVPLPIPRAIPLL